MNEPEAPLVPVATATLGPAARAAARGATSGTEDRFPTLVDDLGRWAESLPAWPPADAAARGWQEAAPQLARAVEEAGRPLVVGVLGGTGTGKSTLVNALAGQAVSEAGDIQRPTTMQPVIVAAEGRSLDWLPVDELGAVVVRTSSPALAEIVLVDCPDPDTQSVGVAAIGGQAPPGNRDRLERILPGCDVLLVVSTAQKYRSFSVAHELAAFAPGRPLLFVQTHASRDPDIRADWKGDLERQGFVVPVMYRVDGLDAFRRIQSGDRPDAGFAELVAAIEGELAGRAADRIRRSGGLELVGWLLAASGRRLEPVRPEVSRLTAGVDRESRRLESLLADGIARQLRQTRAGWRRLAADELGEQWQGGAFGWFLQTVSMLAGWLPRARRSVGGLVGQALAGHLPPAVAGTSQPSGSLPADPLDEALGLDDAEVEQSRSVLVGLARRAGFDEHFVGAARLSRQAEGSPVRQMLERTQSFLVDGIRRVTAHRRDHAASSWLRFVFELLFTGMIVAVLARAAWDFFHGRLWRGESSGGLLGESLIWLTIWGAVLRWLAVTWASWGLDRDLAALAASLRDADLVEPLLADVRQAALLAEGFFERHRQLSQEWRSIADDEPPPRNLARLERSASCDDASG